MIDQNLGHDEPYETAKLALLLIGQSVVLTEDSLANLAENLIIEELFISVEFNDVAAEVEQDGSFSGEGGEALRIF